MPDVPEFVSAGEERALLRTHAVSTNNRQVRLWRISAFLTLSPLKGMKRRLFINVRPEQARAGFRGRVAFEVIEVCLATAVGGPEFREGR